MPALDAGATATVVEVSTWEGEGSVFRIRLASDQEVYVARAQLGTVPVEVYYLIPGRQATAGIEPTPGVGAGRAWWQFWKRHRSEPDAASDRGPR